MLFKIERFEKKIRKKYHFLLRPTALQKENMQDSFMIELFDTNDIVLISFVESLMKSEGIVYFVTDQNASVAEGSLGAIRRRFLVGEEYAEEARQIMVDAGLAHELSQRQ